MARGQGVPGSQEGGGHECITGSFVVGHHRQHFPCDALWKSWSLPIEPLCPAVFGGSIGSPLVGNLAFLAHLQAPDLSTPTHVPLTQPPGLDPHESREGTPIPPHRRRYCNGNLHFHVNPHAQTDATQVMSLSTPVVHMRAFGRLMRLGVDT